MEDRAKKEEKIHIKSTVDSDRISEENAKNFKKYIEFIRFFPILFIAVIIIFLLAMYFFMTKPVSVYILLAIFTFLLIRELSTLFFVYKMQRNLIGPLENLQKGMEEVAGGNYGFTIDNGENTSLVALIESFNEMSYELKKVSDTNDKYEMNRKKLLAGISHDLKTPITSILGYVEGINEGVANSPEKMKTYMDIIYKNARYTNTLIDDLFLFSKLDINQMKYQMQKINVKDYFDDIFIEMKIDLEEQGNIVKYTSDIDSSKEMYIDPKMVYRIISNLISNAIKYNDKEQVVLKCKLEEIEGKDGIRVSVKDNGMGIEEKEISHIFDVFYRVDKARNKDIGGSGLGLSISKQLVEAHDGEITAISTIGKGTEFIFTLYNQFNKMWGMIWQRF